MILASASPRRREILAGLGLDFEAVVPEVDELAEGDAREVVVENALRKARAGAAMAGTGEGDLVLGVDTEVVLDGRVLGKPANEDEARASLEALSARTHEVLSGVALVGGRFVSDRLTNSPPEPGAAERTAVAASLVTFRVLDEATLDLYLRSGEWRDRAGGYAIQGLGSLLVERLQGDFSNVVGLPLRTLLELEPGLFA